LSPVDWTDEALTAKRRLVVVVADDDPDMRALVMAALEKDGYHLLEARDGADVVDLLNRMGRPADAIVADIHMPELSGLTLLGGLRNRGCSTPIVLMTAYGGDRVRAMAERLGADATFRKPFDIDDLRTVVMNLTQPSSRGVVGT
jgi:two-component system response regulator (stage 0 sporulation protein F)